MVYAGDMTFDAIEGDVAMGPPASSSHVTQTGIMLKRFTLRHEASTE